MLNYLLRRLLYTPLIIVGVMLLTFILFFVLQKPETVARMHLGKRATPESVYVYLHKRGWDKPLLLNVGQRRDAADGHPYDSEGMFDTIFFNQMSNLAKLNLGISDVTERDLKTVFKEGAIP